MNLRTLRRGCSDKGLVLALEEFLRDEGYYWVEADGVFNDETDEAVRLFQKDYGLGIDGKVGRKTWGKMLELGFHAVELEEDEDWPARPDYLPLSYAARDTLFGAMTYEHAPTPSDPEAVKITNDWVEENLCTIEVSQLKGINGVEWRGETVGKGPADGRVLLNWNAVDPMAVLWDAWEDAGLLGHILTWAGMTCLRFVRGSRTVLSNHARGTAFDINAPWNGLRKTPALKGQRGCLRELVEVAMTVDVDGWRWWWGGWGWPPDFRKKDGMHFELTKV